MEIKSNSTSAFGGETHLYVFYMGLCTVLMTFCSVVDIVNE